MVIVRSLVCLARGHAYDGALRACARCGATAPRPVDLSRRTFLFGALATGAVIAAGPLTALGSRSAIPLQGLVAPIPFQGMEGVVTYDARIFPLLKARMTDAGNSMAAQLATDLYVTASRYPRGRRSRVLSDDEAVRIVSPALAPFMRRLPPGEPGRALSVDGDPA